MGHPSQRKGPEPHVYQEHVGGGVILPEPLIPIRKLQCSMHRHSTTGIDSFLCMHLKGRHRYLSNYVRAA
jgi:hypothetical protein